MQGTFQPMSASAGARGRNRAKAAFLLTGWTLLGTAWQAPAASSPQIVARPALAPARFAEREPVAIHSPIAPAAAPAADIARFVPVVRIELPAPPPAALASGLTAVPELPVPLPPDLPLFPAAVALRPADIEQISDSGDRSPQVAQLDEPEIAPDGAAFAEKAQIAQLSVPRAAERELALLQEDAPSEVAVRFGDRAIGKVAVRISQLNTIDVQLSGLLDVMGDRFPPEEFARLRSSAAADSYVPLDQLRAAGLGLHYDPVYDELVVSA
jgi:hypothetical protein